MFISDQEGPIIQLIKNYHIFRFKYAMVWMKVWKKSASIKNNSDLWVTCTLSMSICKSIANVWIWILKKKIVWHSLIDALGNHCSKFCQDIFSGQHLFVYFENMIEPMRKGPVWHFFHILRFRLIYARNMERN